MPLISLLDIWQLPISASNGMATGSRSTLTELIKLPMGFDRVQRIVQRQFFSLGNGPPRDKRDFILQPQIGITRMIDGTSYGLWGLDEIDKMEVFSNLGCIKAGGVLQSGLH